MKFKVGDYVKIKEGLNARYTEYFTKDMEKYCGKTAKIVKIDIDSCSYKLDIDNAKWFWYEHMVESANKKTYKVTVVGDTVTVKDNKGNIGTAKCSPEDEFDLATGISLAVERLRYKPSLGEFYWTVDFGSSSLATEYQWNNDSIDNKYFKNGVVFKTKEEAMKTAKKMLEVV